MKQQKLILLNFDSLSVNLFIILGGEMGRVHQVLMLYTDDVYLKGKPCVTELGAKLAVSFSWNTIFTWKKKRLTKSWSFWFFRLEYLADIFLKVEEVYLLFQEPLTVFFANDKIRHSSES